MWLSECLDGPEETLHLPAGSRFWPEACSLSSLPQYLSYTLIISAALRAFISSFLSFQILRSPFFHAVIIKKQPAAPFSLPVIVLRLSFLYKSLLSPSTRPCGSAQTSSSSSSSTSPPVRRCSSVQFVSVSSSEMIGLEQSGETYSDRQRSRSEARRRYRTVKTKPGQGLKQEVVSWFLLPLCHPLQGSEVRRSRPFY